MTIPNHQRRIVTLLIFLIVSVDGRIVVSNSGVHKFSFGSMALSFYAEVHNIAGHGFNTEAQMELQGRLEMVSCCQYRTLTTLSSSIFDSPEADCESMKVHSGLGQWIKPGETRTLAAFFPTSHILNRHGSCLFRLSQEETDVFEIAFNTIPTDVLVRRDGVSHCSELDLDPLQSCAPVSCLHKYGGYRSFFDEKTESCIPTPSCVDEPHKLIILTAEQVAEYKPSKYLDETTNQCVQEDTETKLTETDATETRVDGATKRLQMSPAPARVPRSDDYGQDPWYYYELVRNRNRFRRTREDRRSSMEQEHRDEAPGFTVFGVSLWKLVLIAFCCIMIIWVICALLNWRFQLLPVCCISCDDLLFKGDSNKKPASKTSKFKLVEDDDDSDAIEEVRNRREKQSPKPGTTHSEETQTFRNVLKINESTSTDRVPSSEALQKSQLTDTSVYRLDFGEPGKRLPDVEELLKKFNRLKKQSCKLNRPEFCDPKGQGDFEDMNEPDSPRISISNSTQSFKPQPPSVDHADSFTVDESMAETQVSGVDPAQPQRKPFTVSRCCSPIVEMSVDGAAGDCLKVASSVPLKPVSVDQATQYDRMSAELGPLEFESNGGSQKINRVVPPIPPRAPSISARGSAENCVTSGKIEPIQYVRRNENVNTFPVSPPTSVSDLNLKSKFKVEPIITKKSVGNDRGKLQPKVAMKSQSSQDRRFVESSPHSLEMVQAAHILRRIVQESSASEEGCSNSGTVKNRQEILRPVKNKKYTNPFLTPDFQVGSSRKVLPIEAPSQLNLTAGRQQWVYQPLEMFPVSSNSINRSTNEIACSNVEAVDEVLNVELID